MIPEKIEPVHAYVDGSSRGNPGPSAIGVVIFGHEKDPVPIYEHARYIGTATNNIAEYEALIHALKWIIDNGHAAATIHMDSELVYKQVTGQYRVKSPRMVVQLKRVKQLTDQTVSVSFQLVPRQENKHANSLAQKASQNNRSKHKKFTQEPLL